MQNWEKTTVQCLVRNTHSAVYYARVRFAGKLKWKSLGTATFSVAKAKLPPVLSTLGRARLATSSSAIRTVGQAAEMHTAKMQMRVDIKPATKKYYVQLQAAIFASWPSLAQMPLASVSEIAIQAW